jgi:hypothetical protein
MEELVSNEIATATDKMIEEFLAKAEWEMPTRKRLIFAVDATASRQPAWDIASNVQGQMFIAAGQHGGLDVQLVYYRGFGEMKATQFFGSTLPLVQAMSGVTCQAGHTQLAKVLRHVVKEHQRAPVVAAVLIGDYCEEKLDDVGHAAGQVKVPIYAFLEGDAPEGKAAFELIAKTTGGAVVPFNSNSPSQLRDLLGAVAAYVAGGIEALAHHKPEVVRLLTNRSPLPDSGPASRRSRPEISRC